MYDMSSSCGILELILAEGRNVSSPREQTRNSSYICWHRSCRKRQVMSIILQDRFGKNVMLIPADEEHFTVNVDVYVSRQFLVWAGQKLYLKGNFREVFYNILEKNMMPVYDAARRQEYEIWNYG